MQGLGSELLHANGISPLIPPLQSEQFDSSDSESDTPAPPASQESPVWPPHIYENLDKGKYNPLEGGERGSVFES